MASNALVVTDHVVPKGSALDRSEHELAEAMIEHFEAFYRQGVVLERILKDREFEDAHYSSFDEYMNDRQPLGMKRSNAWELIRAKNVRLLLPTINSGAPESSWSVAAIRPLTHKDFKPADVKRLGKKIATQVKRGEKLTASLVKSICDEDRGVPRKAREKKDKALFEADTPAQALRRIKVDVDLWQSSLAELPGSFWEDAVSDDPRCLKDLIASLSAFASFLRS